MTEHATRPAIVTRRTMLTGAGAGLVGVALASCSRTTAKPRAMASINEAATLATEAKRPHTGRTRAYRLTPALTDIDLGGPRVRTLVYGDTVPGTPIRANVGDELSVAVTNQLDHPTSVHWHGIALRNDMDGAMPASANIAPGVEFTYRFSVPDAGTYWAHPHVGLDTDYGLYLPVIVDDPRERADYDTEWIVVLDDWTHGVGQSPPAIFEGLRKNGRAGMRGTDHGSNPSSTSDTGGMVGMGGMGGMGVGSSVLLGGDAGDIAYPYYLVNGRIPAAPTTFTAKPGQRVRIRIINAGADTAFRVALAGHQMTVTHTDGFPVAPKLVDALLLGMGERYDVVVTVKDGVFPLVAMAEGKNALARALLRTAAGSIPAESHRPAELDGAVGTVDSFAAATQVRLGGRPDVNLKADLGGNMTSYRWTINGRTADQMEPLTIRQGQRARLTFTNRTMMWHPMHLHGHTFQVVKASGVPGPRKDTVIVQPMRSVAVDLVADNPGDWMLHCHNAYHQDAGMMTRLDYRS